LDHPGLAARPLSAQSYPQHPIKIVVAGLPGVPFDILARALADKLSASLKQPVIVENRPGAAGNLGAEAVVRSAHDGYMLLIAPSTTFSVNPSLYKKLPFDPRADFRFLTLGASGASQCSSLHSAPIHIARSAAICPTAVMECAAAIPGSLRLEGPAFVAAEQAEFRPLNRIVRQRAVAAMAFVFGSPGVALERKLELIRSMATAADNCEQPQSGDPVLKRQAFQRIRRQSKSCLNRHAVVNEAGDRERHELGVLGRQSSGRPAGGRTTFQECPPSVHGIRSRC
jgi:hypothetical protein